jgi:hypothetical protein
MKALLFLITAALASGGGLPEALSQHDLSWDGAETLSLTKSSVHQGDRLTFQTLVAEGGKTRLELSLTSPIDREQAEKTGRLRYLSVEDLYSARNTPYYGALTKLSECPPDKKPKAVQWKILGEDRRVLLLNASASYAFGVWDKEEIKKRAAFVVAYDAGKRALLEIKVFQPVDEFSETAVLKLLQGLHDR